MQPRQPRLAQKDAGPTLPTPRRRLATLSARQAPSATRPPASSSRIPISKPPQPAAQASRTFIPLPKALTRRPRRLLHLPGSVNDPPSRDPGFDSSDSSGDDDLSETREWIKHVLMKFPTSYGPEGYLSVLRGSIHQLAHNDVDLKDGAIYGTFDKQILELTRVIQELVEHRCCVIEGEVFWPGRQVEGQEPKNGG